LSDIPKIELTDVEVAHEAQPAAMVLRVDHWTISPGDWWAVCGRSGSGKTSLLCTGAGLTAPVVGTLRAFGQEYWNCREAERLALGRRIGFVFGEGGRLFAHMSVIENLILPLQYHTSCGLLTARERALELLAWVELEDWAERAPARLTTAQQRRAAVARMMTLPVEVLFLDALLVGLPPEDVYWWLDLLHDLSTRERASGGPVSIIASDFEFSDWLGRANRFAVLRDGAFQSISESEAKAISSRGPGGRDDRRAGR
jgi:ABC-type transporter Mla maintaining outer membrane lipid asymmetry ATPase subunit MlaF